MIGEITEFNANGPDESEDFWTHEIDLDFEIKFYRGDYGAVYDYNSGWNGGIRLGTLQEYFSDYFTDGVFICF